MGRSLTLTLLFITLSVGAFAVHPPEVTEEKASTLHGITFDENAVLTAEAILANKPKEFEEKYGVDLGFKEKVAYSFTRRQLKRAAKKGKDLDELMEQSSGGGGWFNAWGFVLGLLLGLIGWLIAIIFWPKGSGAGKSAILGFVIALVIAGIIVLIV